MKIVDVKGTIISQEDKWIYDWLEYPYTTSNDVNNQLRDANGEDVQVNINSNGGSVYVGSEIYTSLKSYSGNVTINIVGMAASAASVISMAAKCLMSPTGQMMIHNASMGAQGDYRDMEKASEILQSVNKSIANAYQLKTGMSDEELKNIMDNETWLTAQEAKDLGLIDEIMFENTQQSNNSTLNFNNSLIMPSNKAIEELKKCGSVESFKKNIINNKVQNTVNSVIDNKENEEECKTMDLDTLKNEHKDIYDQVVSEATNSERERIKGIEDLAIPGNEDIINKAKFETGLTAEAVAVEIIKAQKAKGTDFINQANKDAIDANLLEVNNIAAPENNKSDDVKDKENADYMAKFMNGGVK
jgi:ATP-dependent Clp endopeptidase proteolytic subunit ClpP